MSARVTQLHVAGGTDVEGFKPGLGITPAIEQKLAEAAVAIRAALDLVEEARQLAEGGSDTNERCSDAIDELQMAVEIVEWQPPAGGT